MSSKTKAKPKKPAKTQKTPAPKKAKAVKPNAVKPAPKAKAAKGETKIEKIIKLLTKAEGASMQRLMDETDWQAHTVRSTISRVVSKKMGLEVESKKNESGIRIYKIVIKS